MRKTKTIRFLAPSLLVAISVLAYLNSLQNTFVYDDVFTVTDNYFIRNWQNFWSLFTHDYFRYSGEATYRPVVTLSYFIDYSIGRLNPLGFHVTNVLFHAVNAVFVFCLVFLIGKCRAVSFLSGVIFALHPLLTETVNAVSYREDLLAATFFLGALLLYVQSKRCNPQSRIRPYLYPLSLFSYLLALCSKEMAITLPLIVFLVDWIFGGNLAGLTSLPNAKTAGRDGQPVPAQGDFIAKGWHGQTCLSVPLGNRQSRSWLGKNAVRYYPGFILVSGFYLFLRFVWLHSSIEKQLAYPDNSMVVNLLTMPKVLSSYIKLLFLPTSFNAEYIISHTKTPLAATFIFSIVFLCVVGVVTWRCYNHSRRVFFFILWFFVTLAPTMNLIPIANIMAERYLYLPSVGFAAILACLVSGIWRQAGVVIAKNAGEMARNKNGHIRSSVSSQPGVQRALFICIPCLVLILAVPYTWAVIKRNRVWQNPFIFWYVAVKDSPNSSRAHNNLGMIYYQKNATEWAIREFQMAIALEPDPEYHHNLGMAYQKKGMSEEALQEYYQVLAVNPNSALTHNNMGNILVEKGRIDEGILKFKEAIRISRNYYDAHYNLGLAYFKKGLLDAAIDAFQTAIRYEPDHAEAHSCLGTAYANKGLPDPAIAEIKEALRLQPHYPNAWKNLGIIYLSHKKDKRQAQHCFQEFLRQSPRNSESEMIRKTLEELQDEQ